MGTNRCTSSWTISARSPIGTSKFLLGLAIGDRYLSILPAGTLEAKMVLLISCLGKTERL
ncbi:MAG: hypothetical protein AB1861_28840 [Cyanobacteriota bacterium]